jgi:hypothetical protein
MVNNSRNAAKPNINVAPLSVDQLAQIKLQVSPIFHAWKRLNEIGVSNSIEGFPYTALTWETRSYETIEQSEMVPRVLYYLRNLQCLPSVDATDTEWARGCQWKLGEYENRKLLLWEDALESVSVKKADSVMRKKVEIAHTAEGFPYEKRTLKSFLLQPFPRTRNMVDLRVEIYREGGDYMAYLQHLYPLPVEDEVNMFHLLPQL